MMSRPVKGNSTEPGSLGIDLFIVECICPRLHPTLSARGYEDILAGEMVSNMPDQHPWLQHTSVCSVPFDMKVDFER